MNEPNYFDCILSKTPALLESEIVSGQCEEGFHCLCVTSLCLAFLKTHLLTLSGAISIILFICCYWLFYV